jgi:hypothetical protein
MAKKVFISYRHHQAEWVRTTLYPVLSAGGAEVVIDYKEFAAGLAVRRQMKTTQDKADIHLLVLTPEYFKSDYCVEEMKRAFALDPAFSKGLVLPVIFERCNLPPEIQKHQPLYVDLTRNLQQDAEAWKLLMGRCEANLGATVSSWISAFKRTTDALQRRKSVNLLVKGLPKWRELIAEVKRTLPDLGVVDLESGKTATQPGLVGEILNVLINFKGKLPKNKEHLAEFERLLEAAQPALLALTHFDRVSERDYDSDLYSSLRYLIMEKRQLTLLVKSRAPFVTLLPKDHALSCLEMETVELGSNG